MELKSILSACSYFVVWCVWDVRKLRYRPTEAFEFVMYLRSVCGIWSFGLVYEVKVIKVSANQYGFVVGNWKKNNSKAVNVKIRYP